MTHTLETINAIVDAARRAPSGDNTQPFRYFWDGTTLTLSVDKSRLGFFLDMGHMPTLLTLGTIIESITIAASQFGLEPNVRHVDHVADTGGDIASIEFQTSTQPPDALYSVIHRRCTDRRMYNGGKLSPEINQAITAGSSRYKSASLRTVTDLPSRLLSYIGDVDQVVWTHRRAHQDLMRWIRFDTATPHLAKGEGMPVATLGANRVEAFLLSLNQSFAAQRVTNLFGGPLISRWKSMRQVRSSAGLVLVTLKSKGAAAVVEAGRVGMRTWLTLNDLGYAAQPLTLAPLLQYARRHNILPSDIKPGFLAIIDANRTVIADSFSLPADEEPIWMFRTGPMDHLPESMRCDRLPLQKVLCHAP